MKSFAGVYVAAVTPHRKQGHEADVGAMLDLLDFLQSAGVLGIALLGSTGEFPHLRIEDRIRLVNLAVKRSRLPILAGVSHSTLDGTLELAREAAAAGAAGLLVMPPYYFHYHQDDIKEFYFQFAKAIGATAPILLYNIPFFTNPIEPETAETLLATGQFAGIKDSSGDFDFFTRLHALRGQKPFSLLIGNDRIFTRARHAGADGVVSGVACAVPELLVSLDRAIQNNATAEIAGLDAKLQEFIQWLDRFPAPAGIKVATAARGLKVGPLAVPLSPERHKQLAEFQEWFKGWLPIVKKAAACALALLACFIAAAQTYTTGPQVLTFFSDVDDSDQPYALYLPKSFDPAKTYPLVISLHGAGSNHRLNLRRVFGQGNRPGETDGEASRYFPRLQEVDYIVASPLARGTMGYQGIGEKDVYDVMSDVKRRFPVDESRIYLTGLSMGGGGALWLGLTRPDLWAAIAPVCPAAPAGAEDLAPNALHIALHLFHGEQDPAVPVDISREWQKRLLDLDTKVEYVEYPGVRHNSWDNAYKNGAIFDWFGQFRRLPFPDRVRFASAAYKYDSAYWVKLEALTPGTLAFIDAKFTAKNRMEITTKNLDGFTLNVTGHPLFSRISPLTVILDGVTLRSKVLSFSKSSKGWRAGRYDAALPTKRRGAEGPISEAVASRHIYVYGAGDSPAPEELERRKDIAARAANWSTTQSHLSLSFAVKSDKQVNEFERNNANLVLFGDKETNRIIASLSDRLPIQLNASAADYGLLFIAPAGNHYALVNSGLPWWTGADQARRPGLRFITLPYRLLMSFGDYVLFKGSLENVIAEGRFDRQWCVPAADAAKMTQTGTVVCKNVP